MVCLKCNEIYDRIIYSPIGEGEKLNGKCYECGSKKYIEWDYKAKKCPQCKDGILVRVMEEPLTRYKTLTSIRL